MKVNFTFTCSNHRFSCKIEPSIQNNIEKLVWMGGTFLEKGNVEEPEHDGTAEWNAFCVLGSGGGQDSI